MEVACEFKKDLDIFEAFGLQPVTYCLYLAGIQVHTIFPQDKF